jgi:hypothetical protein
MAESESEGSEFWKIGECTIQSRIRRPTRQRNLQGKKHSGAKHEHLLQTPAP